MTPTKRARRTKKDWRNTHPGATAAHGAVQSAIKTGRLVRQPCEVCGKQRTYAHHDDYSKLLEVRWLCPFHHRLTMDFSANHGHNLDVYRPELEPRVHELKAQGLTRREVARMLGISEITIWRWVGRWGQRPGKRRLLEPTVRKMRDQGFSMTETARTLSLCSATIWHWVGRWRKENPN